MEEQLQNSPKLGSPTENDDLKYVSGLSTILVATIQEAKDRISQIEYIFCSQLYPNFQSKTKLMQKVSEARRAADIEWKEKESDLLFQIERLNLEKQQTLEENQSLKLEKARSAKELGDKNCELLARLESKQHKVEKLELNLRQKSKEIDEGMKLRNSLLELIHLKASETVNKEKQLKEYEEKTDVLLSELHHLEKKVDELQEELREKIGEVDKGNEIKANLFKKIESLALEIMNLRDQETEKKVLAGKLERLEGAVCNLQKELEEKPEEVEGRRPQHHLHQKTNSNRFERLKTLEESEKEKKLLPEKINGLEEKVNELQADLRSRKNEMTKASDLYKKSLEQIELKTSELLVEKKKRRDVINAYKTLKSQYNYLCGKLGFTKESMLSPQELQDEPDSLNHSWNQITSPDLEGKCEDTSLTACDGDKVKKITTDNDLEQKNGNEVVQDSSSLSPTYSFPIAPKCPSTLKSAPLVGTKRPASCWRATRSHQGQNGHDPHDDFLGTPLENIRGNMNKTIREESRDIPVPVPKDVNVDSSDDETQDVSANQNRQKRHTPVRSIGGEKGFKFVEPVRKKAERENLKGVECRQCKKFYDAVLCGDEGKDGNNIRCEHHEGVSRHRYRYAPPMTPEGFWNIGFESEI
ncbi:hypothetical protein L484_007296 [Morus notabilis]|uniref:DNA endonuclease activator Ctp1 C-terminal domain-containing protein n=1 Tax=Morus notabilis TaxID=981085 RepID=W9QU63_9ROSA|nr:protein gamma response 1 [Morus notabilis]XP_024017702.1 protein gamma response 1 [Morus notabilis]EXB40713.1 hypothetical protein L484_007296 [Morus notabilis]